jgi:hypothetical protein
VWGGTPPPHTREGLAVHAARFQGGSESGPALFFSLSKSAQISRRGFFEHGYCMMLDSVDDLYGGSECRPGIGASQNSERPAGSTCDLNVPSAFVTSIDLNQTVCSRGVI